MSGVYVIENEEGMFWKNEDGWVPDPRDAELYNDTSKPTIGSYVLYPDVIITVSGGVASVAESPDGINVVVVALDFPKIAYFSKSSSTRTSRRHTL